MPAKDLGTQHVCFKCGTKFYDMRKPEAICPKCGADQKDSPANRPAPEPRRGRLAAVPRPVEPPPPEETPRLAEQTPPEAPTRPREGPGQGSGEGPAQGPGKGILAFREAWNEFNLVLGLTSSPGSRTLPYELFLMTQTTGFQDNPGQAAFAIMTIIPFIFVYLRLERYVVSGLTSGALK